jgi:PKD repeat protein
VVNFTSTSTGTTISTNYYWYFGDGGFSNLMNPTHTYTTNGWIGATLYIVDGSCSDSLTQWIYTGNPCSLTASFTHTVGLNGNVSFQSTSTGTTLSTSYFWSFGDGNTGNTPTTSHTYSNGGAHLVYLYVNDGGCWSVDSQYVNVNTIPCLANSGFSLYWSGTPQYWYAIPNYYGNVTNAVWSWGDGSYSNNLWTSHNYASPGNYSICLSVTVSCGNTSTTCASYNIYRSAVTNTAMQMVSVNVVKQIPTGVKELNEEHAAVGLYPNPNNGKMNIVIDGIDFNTEKVSVEAYDILGKSVYSTTLMSNDGKIDEWMDLQHLSNGAYYLKIKTDNKIYTAKTIISK